MWLEYTDDEYINEKEEADQSALVTAAWQYADEVEYQTAVATSYPQDANAILAANWLRMQGQL